MAAKSLKRQHIYLAMGMVGCLGASTYGFATPLVIPAGGAQANISGCITVSPTGVVFANTVCTTPNIFDAGSPDTGSYAGLSGGTIMNLPGAASTGNLPTPIVNFATFTTTSGIVHFDLTRIDPGFGTVAGCTSGAGPCTLANSPFTLVQTATGKVAISYVFEGNAYLNSSSSGVSPSTFAFTSQNTVPGTITGILALAGATGGFQNSYSATIASTSGVPEPGTLMMLSGGLSLLGAGLIRRRRSNS